MRLILDYLHAQPFVLLFLTVAGGYALGKVPVKGFALGATAGILIVGIGFSAWASARHGVQFELPAFASTIFFNLFMFAVGMKVGPQFVSATKRGVKNSEHATE